MSGRDNNNNERGNFMTRALKGAILGAVASVFLIVLASVAMLYGIIDDSIINILTPFIKAICASISALIAIKGYKNHTMALSIISSIMFIIISYLLYSALSGEFMFGTNQFIDIGIGAFAGIITALVSTMVSKR